jgi:hypothetical protein
MIMDKYRSKKRLPLALHSSRTAAEEVGNEITSVIPIDKNACLNPSDKLVISTENKKATYALSCLVLSTESRLS